MCRRSKSRPRPSSSRRKRNKFEINNRKAGGAPDAPERPARFVILVKCFNYYNFVTFWCLFYAILYAFPFCWTDAEKPFAGGEQISRLLRLYNWQWIPNFEKKEINTMKKITLLCILTLALSLLALPALAAPGDAALFPADMSNRGSRVDSVAVWEGTYYIVYDGQIYTWHVGDEAPALLAEKMQEYQVSEEETSNLLLNVYIQDGKLYTINKEAGLLIPLKIENGVASAEKIVKLDYTDLSYTETWSGHDYVYPLSMVNWTFCGGKLFMTALNDNGNDNERLFVSFNPETGEKTMYETKGVYKCTPYKDGKLLCMVVDENGMWDNEKEQYRPLSFSIFDPETDTLAPVGEIAGIEPYKLSAVLYDAAADTLYLPVSEKIYRSVSFGPLELCAYVPISYFEEAYYRGMPAVYDNGYVLAKGENGLFARNVDPQYLPEFALSIYGGYADYAHNQAIAKLDDLAVTFYDKAYYSTAQEMGQALVSGENQIDILKLSLSYIDFQRLMDKGYCYDLSASETLSAYADSLYPFIKEGMSKDGKLYAVPVDCYNHVFSYTTALDELGLPAPATLLDLVQFLQDWGDNGYYETYSEYQPIDWVGIKSQLFNLALSLYQDYCEATKQPLSFSSPLLRQVLQAVENLDVSDWETKLDWETATDEDWNDFYQRDFLFLDYSNLSPRYYSKESTVMQPLKLTEDTPLAIGMEIEVFFINPRSAHPEAALRYLEAYVESMDVFEKVKMCPAMNDPIENPQYESNIKAMEQRLAEVKAAAEKAEGADKTDAEEQVKMVEESMTQYAAKARYTATAESIAAYRAWDQYFFLRTANVLSTDDGDMSSLTQRYLDGQIPLDQFLQEADAKLRLMQLENQ